MQKNDFAKNRQFQKPDFDNNGRNKNGELFSDILYDWERELSKKFNPFFANHVLANSSTMILLQKCFVLEDNEDFGMDGEFDLETNLKIEKYSQ